jgi:hypothetical protein
MSSLPRVTARRIVLTPQLLTNHGQRTRKTCDRSRSRAVRLVFTLRPPRDVDNRRDAGKKTSGLVYSAGVATVATR